MELTVKQAASLLRTPERQIYRWIDEGVIPFYRVSDQFRFNQTELLEWATARRISVSRSHLEEGPGAFLVGLAETLRRGGIHHHLREKDRDAVLRAVVGHMPLREG